jgi:hypothetical protein
MESAAGASRVAGAARVAWAAVLAGAASTASTDSNSGVPRKGSAGSSVTGGLPVADTILGWVEVS